MRQDAARSIMEIATSEGQKRRENPGDDLLTWVIQAEFEGERICSLRQYWDEFAVLDQLAT